MIDVLIVGAGPAGISAALYAKRSNTSVTVLYQRGGALLKTDRIENYYGFPDGISGEQLFNNGLEQAKKLGVELVEDEVLAVQYTGAGFIVQTKTAEFESRTLIFATGAGRLAPKIPGIAELEGHGVSYCAVCDAFFYRGKDVAVLGFGEYALHEALALQPVAGSVTILTNGETPHFQLPEGISLRTEPVESITGSERVEQVNFAQAQPLPVAGVFIAYGTAGSSQLARTLGAQLDGNRIAVDENQQTSIEGLYACGDCVGGLLQIAKAVHDGAVAGMQAAKFAQLQKKG